MHDSINLPFHQHAMLLCSKDDGGADELALKYVNEALMREHLTIYISANIDNNNLSGISERTSKIINYEDKVNQGNLLTLDLRPFYDSALAGDEQAFEELKVIIEAAINERTTSGKSHEVTIVSSIAGTLAANQKFKQCINVEKWGQNTHSEWSKKGLKVTTICPHPSPTLDKSELMHYKQAISSLHHVTLDPGC